MPTEPPQDLVIEAREWCESSDAMLDEPMRQRLAQLCDEIERLRGLVDEWETAAGAAFREDTNGTY